MLAGVSNIPISKKSSAAKTEPPKKRKELAEDAGVAAAGCAAVACCCPCCLLGLIVLTAAKFPAKIGRRIARKRQQRAISGLLGRTQKTLNSVTPDSMAAEETVVIWPERSPAAEVSEMEEKMWAQFSGTGFWRSRSQRE